MTFRDKKGREVEISKPNGAGGNSYYITVDNFHFGQIVLVQNGSWLAYPNNDELPRAYWFELVKLVEKIEKEVGG